MDDSQQNTPQTAADSSQQTSSDQAGDSSSAGNGRTWLWLLAAAVAATCCSAFIPSQLGDYFKVSKEMADMAPNSPQIAKAEAAAAVVQRKNHALVISVIGGLTGLLFGIAAGLIRSRNAILTGSVGLVLGLALGFLCVMATGLVESQLAITPNSKTTVESQDTQKMLKAAISQWLFFLTMGFAAVCTFLAFGRKTSGPRKPVSFIVATIGASILCIAIYQVVLAIGFPTQPFDEFIPSSTSLVWIWLVIPNLLFAFAFGRLSRA